MIIVTQIQDNSNISGKNENWKTKSGNRIIELKLELLTTRIEN